MLSYMGYTISNGEPANGKFITNIERQDARGRPEQLTLSADSQDGALEAAKRLVRLAVRNKLPLELAQKVSSL